MPRARMSPRSSKNCSIKMKRSLLTLLLLALCVLAAAQENKLKSCPVLRGEVVPASRLVETLVKDGNIEGLGLTLFHSVRFTADAQELVTSGALVLEDASTALSRRTVLQGGLLHSAFLQTSRNGYLAFQSKPEREAGKFAVILVYMEGDISEKQLRELFSNQ